MKTRISKYLKPAVGGAAAATLTLATLGAPAMAQPVVSNEQYVPTIWIDPDGCEH